MTSIFEVKYVVISQGAKEGIWIRQFINYLLSNEVVKIINILENNKITFTLIKELRSQNQTKYINMIHYYMRGLIEKKETIGKVDTQYKDACNWPYKNTTGRVF